MSKCGICLIHDKTAECYKCRVCICGNDCRHAVRLNAQSLVGVCSMCMSKGNFTIKNITLYKYCRSCEWIGHPNYFYSGECIDCAYASIMLVDNKRQLLPHYNAKPLIEEIYNIKGIAQLIFDYYYNPRRYYEGEF